MANPSSSQNESTQQLPAVKAPQARLKKSVKLFALGGFVLAVVGSLFTPDAETTAGLWIICSLPFLILLVCVSNRCRQCRAWWSVKEIARQRLDTYGTTKTVIRKKERKDSKGQLIHTETWQENIPITMAVDDVTLRCKYCQKTYTQKRKHEI